MRLLTRKSYGTLVVLAVTAHCGKANAPATAPVTAAVAQEDAISALDGTADLRYTELKGNWRAAACSKLDAGSAQQAKIFTKAHVITVIDSFSDLACATLRERFFIVASYKTGDLVAGTTSRKIDFGVTGLAASFNDPAAIKALNAAKVCGFSDWAAGLPKDLTNNPCITTTPLAIGLFKSPSDFNVYQVTSGTLLLGKEDAAHDGLADGHRPAQLGDATTALTKQSKDDDAMSRLDVLLASNGIKAAAAEPSSALRTVKLSIPELPAAADPAAKTHLEVVFAPTNPFKQTLVFQAQTVNSITSPGVSVDTYTVTVLQVDGTSTTPKASGSAPIVMTGAVDQPLTVHVK